MFVASDIASYWPMIAVVDREKDTKNASLSEQMLIDFTLGI